MGIFTIFGTSLRALNTYATAMGVVSNNIANSSNDNYSRQTVSFQSLTPETTGGIEVGRGVEVSNVQQVINRFVESRMTTSLQSQGYYDATTETVRSIEELFNETDGSGLNQLMSNFFDSWTALSAEPDNTVARTNLTYAANNMVELFHQYDDALTDMRSTIDLEVSNLTDSINAKLEEISELNQRILEDDGNSLAFKDQRRAAVNELAEMIDINVVQTGTNDEDLQVYLSTGVPLINGVSIATFSTSINLSNNNLLDVSLTMGGATTNVTTQLTSGRLAGLIEVRDTQIDSYIDRLDELAYQMISGVNTLHAAGYTLGGATGQNFFNTQASAANAARDISLHANIVSNTSYIAASSTLAGVPGNNTQALSIAALDDSTSIAFGSGNNSFRGFYSDFLAQIGNDSSLAQGSQRLYQGLVEQVKLDRSQNSGVNVDEEQILLVKYQAAYQAAGRMIRVADGILQTLIEAVS